ncbi:DUF3108 domain-containing protein [Pleionea sediminis]|uniref:DUF3108 domain-containing protein n=1 Tax=Pleionea sediminis TaxID=2569479 RepID=UPI0013DE5543|nr:DUF3108 domain-containing protein [Pleionea sediminis]
MQSFFLSLIFNHVLAIDSTTEKDSTKTLETTNTQPVQSSSNAVPTPEKLDNAENQYPRLKELLLPYRATYDILDGDKSVGVASRSLLPSQEAWILKQETEIQRWYYKYSFTESSTFTIEDNKLYPQKYESKINRSFKENRTTISQFDWDKKIERGERNNKTWTLELPNQVFDQLSYQFFLRNKAQLKSRKERLHLTYKGELESYIFVNEGIESVETPLGKLETILWTQQPKFKHDKVMHLWLAPTLNYLPVQISQFRGSEKEGTIRLKSIKWFE